MDRPPTRVKKKDRTGVWISFATHVGVTSKFPHTVQSGFDSIRVGRQSCRITDIRTVNYKQMRADLKAEKKARG